MFRIGTLFWLCWAVWSFRAVLGAPTRPSETLFPKTTEVWFAIHNVNALGEHWQRSQLGRVMGDPIMNPFVRDLEQEFEEQWSNIRQRLLLTLDDIKRVASGETAIAVVGTHSAKSALCVVVDVSGKLPEARVLLDKVAARQSERGAEATALTVETHTVARYGRADLRTKEEPREARRIRGERPIVEGSQGRHAFYCLTDNLFVATDSLDAMRDILTTAARPAVKGKSLADHAPFQAVMLRCQGSRDPTTFQIRWFLHPLAPELLAERSAVVSVPSKRNITFDVGGLIEFSAGGRDIGHRTTVCAPHSFQTPWARAMMREGPEFVAQSWVPDDVSTYTTFYANLHEELSDVGPLLGDLFGQRQVGEWKDILRSLKHDPNGPHVDIGQDLMRYLGPRVTILTDRTRSIPLESDRLLLAVETTDCEAVAAAIRRFLDNDPTFKLRREKGLEYWEMDRSKPPATPPVRLGQAPPMTRFQPLPEEPTSEEAAIFPRVAISVWKGNLVIASHPDYLLKVIAPEKKPKPLSGNADYRRVHDAIRQVGSSQQCLEFFSRTDDECRPTYEMRRRNKPPRSELMIARALGLLFRQKRRLPTTPTIEGTEVPWHQAVGLSPGPAGFRVTHEVEGWFAEGLTLGRGSARPSR